MSPYFDAYGLLNDCIPITPSENRSLWLSELFLIDPKDDEVSHTVDSLKKCYSPEDNKWYPVPDKTTCADEFFSRDNMIGVTAVGKFTGDKFLAKAGMKNFNYRYLQPQDVIFFAFCAGNWLSYLFLPFLWLNMLWSSWRNRTCGTGVMDTDGRILTFVRCAGAVCDDGLMSKVWLWWFLKYTKISNVRVKKFLTENPDQIPEEFKGQDISKINVWRLIFSIYFRDIMHPIRCKFREMNNA
jgi:hypothetical protein